VRFFFDNDVDFACVKIAEAHGHDAWHTSQAGRSDATDLSQRDYAYKRHAVVVTHDREFTNRAKEHMVGQHMRLNVENVFAADTFEFHLDHVVYVFERFDDLVITLTRNTCIVTYPSGGEQKATKAPRQGE
jgi:predicted nuclease of predicted toxin-antitoxin system